MTTSPAGRALIERFEGLRTSAYQDQRNIWTIGYGHTGAVVEGQSCTQCQADAFLESDLATAENCINDSVRAVLSQNQFDALVSLVFNIGCGNFQESTLLRCLNADNFSGAASEFLRWCRTAGQINPGLLARRESEQALFLRSE